MIIYFVTEALEYELAEIDDSFTRVSVGVRTRDLVIIQKHRSYLVLRL
jgi:hypothetical protein